MSYQLKSTGIAANCTMCIAVDPDDGTIKDFASSSVTADITTGANVTISSQAWDGITRSYFQLGAGTTAADFVAFGTNKPQWDFNSGESRTWVAIAEVAGSAMRVMGGNSGAYMASQNLGAGGATFPTVVLGGTATGGGAALSAGAKRIFGFSLVHNTSSTYFYAADTDTSMTTGSATTLSPSGTTFDFALSYVGRRNDSTAHQTDKIHAILIFNTALSESDWDSLRDDWFNVLLESTGPTGYTLALDEGSYSISGQTLSPLAFRTLALNEGSYNISGQDVMLTYEQPGVYTLTLDAGAYTINGVDAFRLISMSLDAGTYNVSGQDVTLSITEPQAYSISLDSGTYNWLGRSANLRWSGEPEPTVKTTGIYVGFRMGL